MPSPLSNARRDHNGQTVLASAVEREIEGQAGLGAVDGNARVSPVPPAAGLRPKRRRTRVKVVALSVVLPLIPAVVFVAIWQAYTNSAGTLVIPAPIDVVEGFWSLIGSADVWEAFWISNQAFLIGFAISLLIGVPLGIAMGRFRKLELLVDGWLSTMLVTPMAMLVPLLIMAFGFSLSARGIVVVLFALPIVTVNCRAGVREVDPSLVEMARTFGAGEVTVWRRILCPPPHRLSGPVSDWTRPRHHRHGVGRTPACGSWFRQTAAGVSGHFRDRQALRCHRHGRDRISATHRACQANRAPHDSLGRRFGLVATLTSICSLEDYELELIS